MAYFLLYHKINHLKVGPYSPCSLRFLARAAMCLTHALKCQVNSACENIFALFCFVSFRFVFLLFFFKLIRRNYWRKNRSQVWLRCSTIITLLKFIKKGRWEVNNVTLLQRGIFEISNRNFLLSGKSPLCFRTVSSKRPSRPFFGNGIDLYKW